jgi:hypothetical protein
LLLRRGRSLTVAKAEEKDGVDELNEMIHTLLPLLLTNTTIRKRSKRSKAAQDSVL